MHSFHFDSSLATDRHRELLDASVKRRQVASLRRRARAARLQRKAAGLTRRAEALVHNTHR